MKYEADVKLFKEGGRTTALGHSPIFGHIKFETTDIEGYSVRVFYDDQNAWKLGETRVVSLEFLFWEEFPKNIEGLSFYLFEGELIGTGTFRRH